MTPETQHLLNVLRSAIRVLGYTFNDVAEKLGVGSGYMSRLFAGKIELKFDHVVNISRAIGFEPEEILHLAYPRVKEPQTLAAQQYQALLTGGDPSSRPAPRSSEGPDDVDAAVARAIQKLLSPAAPPPPSEEDLEKIVERMIQKFFARLSQGQAQTG
ncbi:MAG: helix-turn-helix domain-containing protein [Thermoanaerobaculia bacterium]